jgi:hypothetical protein
VEIVNERCLWRSRVVVIGSYARRWKTLPAVDRKSSKVAIGVLHHYELARVERLRAYVLPWLESAQLFPSTVVKTFAVLQPRRDSWSAQHTSAELSIVATLQASKCWCYRACRDSDSDPFPSSIFDMEWHVFKTPDVSTQILGRSWLDPASRDFKLSNIVGVRMFFEAYISYAMRLE